MALSSVFKNKSKHGLVAENCQNCVPVNVIEENKQEDVEQPGACTGSAPECA